MFIVVYTLRLRMLYLSPPRAPTSSSLLSALLLGHNDVLLYLTTQLFDYKSFSQNYGTAKILNIRPISYSSLLSAYIRWIAFYVQMQHKKQNIYFFECSKQIGQIGQYPLRFIFRKNLIENTGLFISLHKQKTKICSTF